MTTEEAIKQAEAETLQAVKYLCQRFGCLGLYMTLAQVIQLYTRRLLKEVRK